MVTRPEHRLGTVPVVQMVVVMVRLMDVQVAAISNVPDAKVTGVVIAMDAGQGDAMISPQMNGAKISMIRLDSYLVDAHHRIPIYVIP